jgi:hypothetical protein
MYSASLYGSNPASATKAWSSFKSIRQKQLQKHQQRHEQQQQRQQQQQQQQQKGGSNSLHLPTSPRDVMFPIEEVDETDNDHNHNHHTHHHNGNNNNSHRVVDNNNIEDNDINIDADINSTCSSNVMSGLAGGSTSSIVDVNYYGGYATTSTTTTTSGGGVDDEFLSEEFKAALNRKHVLDSGGGSGSGGNGNTAFVGDRSDADAVDFWVYSEDDEDDDPERSLTNSSVRALFDAAATAAATTTSSSPTSSAHTHKINNTGNSNPLFIISKANESNSCCRGLHHDEDYNPNRSISSTGDSSRNNWNTGESSQIMEEKSCSTLAKETAIIEERHNTGSSCIPKSQQATTAAVSEKPQRYKSKLQNKNVRTVRDLLRKGDQNDSIPQTNIDMAVGVNAQQQTINDDRDGDDEAKRFVRHQLHTLKAQTHASSATYRRAMQALSQDLRDTNGEVAALQIQLQKAIVARDEKQSRLECAKGLREHEVEASAVQMLHFDIVLELLNVDDELPSINDGTTTNNKQIQQQRQADLFRAAGLLTSNTTPPPPQQHRQLDRFKTVPTEELKVRKQRLKGIYNLIESAKHKAEAAEADDDFDVWAQSVAMKEDAANKYILYDKYKQI